MKPSESSAKKSKKNKKRKSLSESVTSSENGYNDSNLEVKDQSSIIEKSSPLEFTFLIDDKHPRFEKIKTSHAVLLHPSVIKAFSSPWYFYIKGKEKCSLCIPFNQKNVKKATIVSKKSFGFGHGEIVELYPYPGLVTKAANVTVSFDVEINSSEKIEDEVLDILRNQKFFCLGMKFDLPALDGCQFSLSSILPIETESCTDISQSNITNDFTCEPSEYSLAELTSNVSELSLTDASLSSNYECDLQLLPEASIPTFFKLCTTTTVTIKTPENKMTKQSTIETSFDDIIGLDQELHSMKVFINSYLAVNNSYESTAIVFISGSRGSGKSMILEAISKEFTAHIEILSWYNIYSINLSEGMAKLKETFDRARTRAPSIVLIDDFHYLLPSSGSEKNTSRVLSQEIKSCVGKKVVLVIASNDANSEQAILGLENTDVKSIKLQLHDVHQREKIIIKCLEKENYCLSAEEIKFLASKSQGFTGKDLTETFREAAKHHFCNTGAEGLSFSAVEHILNKKKHTVSISEVKIKKVKWEDIGGMCQLKDKLRSIIEDPLKYPEAYKRFGVKSPRGVLLYGPPGCSKTMIAKAIATECDFHFISKNVSDIHNKYVGESEKAVHDLFVSARANAPCIVFLDEIDALIPSRGSSTGSGVEERVVNTFLQEIDGIEELNNVILVAATNRPDRIDEAFLRYGRINHHIYVPLPDLEGRKEILSIHKKNRIVDPSVDFDELALKTEGYSGAEIVNLWNEAAFQVLYENQECRIFKMHHFEKALQVIPPRTDKKLLEIYSNFNSKFCTNG